jgi:hypothetical protein
MASTQRRHAAEHQSIKRLLSEKEEGKTFFPTQRRRTVSDTYLSSWLSSSLSSSASKPCISSVPANSDLYSVLPLLTKGASNTRQKCLFRSPVRRGVSNGTKTRRHLRFLAIVMSCLVERSKQPSKRRLSFGS